MPFTFAHPAAVLPFINDRKKLFSSSGLVIGSIIPDFESFVMVDTHKVYGHTWLGILWFDLPLAIIVSFIFHGIARDPLIRNLPNFIGNKFRHIIGFSWWRFFKKHFIVVIVSMLIGITSHLLLDAFTHLNLADPDATDSNIYVGGIRLYLFLQYSISLLGLLLLVFYVIKMPTERSPKLKHDKMRFKISSYHKPKNNKMPYWIVFAVLASITIVISLYTINDPVDIILFIDIIILGILVSLIITPLLLRAIQPTY